MARKRFTTEEIIGLLREAEIRLSQGQTIGSVCRGLGVSEQSYYRWRREYGGLKLDQAKHYNAVRPHPSLKYRPPAPEAILLPASGLPYAVLRPVQMLANDGRVLTWTVAS